MKRIVALLLAAAMVLGMAGCGSQTKTTQPETTNPVSTEKTGTEPSGTEPQEETPELNAHLEYWSSWGETESHAKVLQEAAAEFTKLNPGVTINFTFNGRDNRNLVVSAIEAGTDIDMMDANWDNCTASWSDYLADLTEYYSKTYPTTDGKPYVDCVMSAYSSLIANDGGGAYRGIAYIPQAFMIFCNKDIFEACGITSYPTTWDELMEVCKTIKDAGYIPITD